MRLEICSAKCTGCRVCQIFCSYKHEDAIWIDMSRITICSESDDGPFEPNHCRQCDDAPCAASCPVDAIAQDPVMGAWIVDVAECTACGSCMDACPYDAIFVDEDRGFAIKCDLCGGQPECVEMCPTAAIVLVE